MPPTHVFSFGYRHGSLDTRAYSDPLVLDVRLLIPKNPYHNKALRKLRGTDKAVQDEIRRTSKFDEAMNALKARLATHHGPVFLGCTGGHHRSVFIAILMGEHFGCPVTHLDIDVP